MTLKQLGKKLMLRAKSAMARRRKRRNAEGTSTRNSRMRGEGADARKLVLKWMRPCKGIVGGRNWKWYAQRGKLCEYLIAGRIEQSLRDGKVQLLGGTKPLERMRRTDRAAMAEKLEYGPADTEFDPIP